MATAVKRCEPVLETWQYRFLGIGRVSLSPRVLKKDQTSISQDIEEKILSMYAKGMTTGDIEAHIQDIYGISVSDSTVSRITDKILPVAREWQQRPLETIYAVVFLDAIPQLFCRGCGVDPNYKYSNLGKRNITSGQNCIPKQ